MRIVLGNHSLASYQQGEAVAGVAEIDCHYGGHSPASREIAEGFFPSGATICLRRVAADVFSVVRQFDDKQG